MALPLLLVPDLIDSGQCLQVVIRSLYGVDTYVLVALRGSLLRCQ